MHMIPQQNMVAAHRQTWSPLDIACKCCKMGIHCLFFVGVFIVLCEWPHSLLCHLFEQALSTTKGYNIWNFSDFLWCVATIRLVLLGPKIHIPLVFPFLNSFQAWKRLVSDIKEIKEHNGKIPVVMLTNLASENMIKKSFELGAQGYLLKSRITKTP